VPVVLGHNIYDIASSPEIYDIVWVNFPYDEAPYEPGPDRHPGLVLSKSVFKDKNTELNYASLQIAYGTSQPQNDRLPWEVLRVHNYVALDRCGLCRDTSFILSRVQRLLWCEEYFPISEHGTPILGKLPHAQILALKTLKEVRDALKKKSSND